MGKTARAVVTGSRLFNTAFGLPRNGKNTRHHWAPCKAAPLQATRRSLTPAEKIAVFQQSARLKSCSASRLSASQARRRSRSGDPLGRAESFSPYQPLKVVPLVDGINLFAGRRDLLAKLIVVGLGLLISKVRLIRLPGFPVLIEEG
jgi:hypothetical protein